MYCAASQSTTRWTSGGSGTARSTQTASARTFSPEQVAEEEGFHVLAWIGEHIEIQTVGIAVDEAHIPLERKHCRR